MSVTIKTIGKERIRVKETMTQKSILFPSILLVVFGAISLALTMSNSSITGLSLIVFFAWALMLICGFALRTDVEIFPRWMTGIKPAYYVDTTTPGIGGITIKKVDPSQDRIAICKASKKLELQMIQRIKSEDGLKDLVKNCD